MPVVEISDESQLAAALENEDRQAFDLEHGPLIRCRFSDWTNGHVFSLTAHHIVCDGWAYDILLRDLVRARFGIDRRVATRSESRSEFRGVCSTPVAVAPFAGIRCGRCLVAITFHQLRRMPVNCQLIGRDLKSAMPAASAR